jgi:hypothetical protein|tara:strand:+ start:5548 stop:5751 length:204 start_codon:yes stop_codon:yes gene_type:complete
MKSNLKHRIILSTIVVLCFGLTIGGILISMHSEATVDSEWKELLLLLLGALIGNFGKVVDYWFNKDT